MCIRDRHYGNTDFELDHAPLVADFDNDDTLDVFIVGGHAEYPNFQNNFGRAYMISAGKGNGPNWLMFQNDIRRQSSLCSSIPTAINETAALHNINVFPNPTANEINLVLDKDAASKIQIFNIVGILVYQTSASGEIKIDVSNFSQGVYSVQIYNKNNNFQISKFIKQ